MKQFLAVLSFLLWAQPSFAADVIARGNFTDGGNNGGTGSRTFSHTVASGSNRIIWLTCGGGTIGSESDDLNTTPPTVAGVSMTLAGKNTVNSAHSLRRYSYLWYLASPPAGSVSIVVGPGVTHYILCVSEDYHGASGILPDTVVINRDNTNPTSTLTSMLTTSVDNSWIIIAELGPSSMPPAAGSGASLLGYDSGFHLVALFDTNAAVHPAGSTSMTTTIDSGEEGIVHIMASMKPGTTVVARRSNCRRPGSRCAQ